MTSLRPSGISSVQALPWGTHICALYNSSQDLVKLLVPYFKSGLTHNEYCMWITSKELPVSLARNAMQEAFGAKNPSRLKLQMEIFSQTDWYLKHRRFDSARVKEVWMEKLSYAREQGYEGVRVCGVVPWFNNKQLQEFEQYEKKIDKIFARKRIITLCAYSIRKYTIQQLMKALRYHGFVLIQIGNNCQIIELSRRGSAISSAQAYEVLTAREGQIMRLVSEGSTNTEIASILAISIRTVEAHRSNLMRKLGLKNQAALIRFALAAECVSQDRRETG